MTERAWGPAAIHEEWDPLPAGPGSGRHRRASSGGPAAPAGPGRRRPRRLLLAIVAAALAVAATAAGLAVSAHHGPAAVPPGGYLGVYASGVPQSYDQVTTFAGQTGAKPRMVVYYSGWNERFQSSFAASIARQGAVPLVQIDPTGINVARIAGGWYDGYLRSYATAVKQSGQRVILSFGHEMNGGWYSWGSGHTSPATFVAAWRHIVTVFRQVGADNVTWLWTVNIIVKGRDPGPGQAASPAAWWPGARYVTWVGIDGYYYEKAWRFASLFGPTIKAVRALTLDPVLISETSALPAAGQAAKVADLFAGVRAYGLLGFVWFNSDSRQDWRLSGQAAFAAYRRGVAGLGQKGGAGQ